jgi:uncharacterized protein (DUF58 family)
MPVGRHTGGDASFSRGHGDDYLGLRLLRDGEDPRDVHWRKSAAVGQLVMRERAREARPDITLPLDVIRPEDAKDDWFTAFERKIRDVASRALAHVKRADTDTIRTSVGDAVRGDRSTGADPLLRFLALVESVDTTSAREMLESKRSASPSAPVPTPPSKAPEPPKTGGEKDTKAAE